MRKLIAGAVLFISVVGGAGGVRANNPTQTVHIRFEDGAATTVTVPSGWSVVGTLSTNGEVGLTIENAHNMIETSMNVKSDRVTRP